MPKVKMFIVSDSDDEDTNVSELTNLQNLFGSSSGRGLNSSNKHKSVVDLNIDNLTINMGNGGNAGSTGGGGGGGVSMRSGSNSFYLKANHNVSQQNNGLRSKRLSLNFSDDLWIDSCIGNIPANAVEGGYDINGEKIYVGRAQIDGDLVPGKIVPSQEGCYISYARLEEKCDHYECMVSSPNIKLKWKSGSNGSIPTGAVKAGHTCDGETLYVARAKCYKAQNVSLVIGKLHPSHRLAYLPFDNKEVCIPSYEVLCVASFEGD